MKLAYIAGPYRAETIYGIKRNIQAAETTALKYWRQGYAVLCPHKNTAFFDGAAPDEVWLAGAIEMMKRCDVVVMMSSWLRSEGAKAEHRVAVEMGMDIIYDGICPECERFTNDHAPNCTQGDEQTDKSLCPGCGQTSHNANCPFRWDDKKAA